MELIIARKIRLLQRPPHHLDIVRRKPECLEVRETPPRFAKFGLQRDGLAVSLDTLGRPPDSLEHMPKAHPDFRPVAILSQKRLIGGDRRLVFAQPHKRRALQRPIVRVAGVLRQQHVHILNDRFGLVDPHADDSEVVARRRKTGRQFQRPHQQGLGIRIPAQPRADFRQHADRHDIGWVPLEVVAQAMLGDRKAPVHQRQRSFQ